MRIFFSFISLLCFVGSSAFAQSRGWVWEYVHTPNLPILDDYKDCQPLPNRQTMVLLGSRGLHEESLPNSKLVVLDSNGLEIWSKDEVLMRERDIPHRLFVRPGNRLPYAVLTTNVLTQDSVFICELDSNGNFANRQFIYTNPSKLLPQDLKMDANGVYMAIVGNEPQDVFSLFRQTSSQHIARIDSPAAPFQKRTFLHTLQGEYVYARVQKGQNSSQPSLIKLVRYDSNTNTLIAEHTIAQVAAYNSTSEFAFFGNMVPSLALCANGDFLILYYNPINSSTNAAIETKLARISAQGQVLSDARLYLTTNANQSQYGLEIAESQDGNYWVMDCTSQNIVGIIDCMPGDINTIRKINPNTFSIISEQSLDWFGDYKNIGAEDESKMYSLPNGGLCILMDKKVIHLGANGDLSNNIIRGTLYHDIDLNCSASATDSVVPQRLVRAVNVSNSNYQYFAYTQANGSYEIIVPNGTYQLSSAIGNHNLVWVDCSNNLTTIAFNTTSPSADTIDIFRQSFYTCPLLVADITNGFLRPCDMATITVQVDNIGTAASGNATYVDVDLDPAFSYMGNSSNYAPNSLGNNKYRFNLPNILSNTQIQFSIRALLDCTTQTGLVHCNEAHVYPDTICGLSWGESNISIQDTCLNGDSIVFRLQNIGGDMLIAQTYNIFEDNLMFRSATPFQLSAGQTLDVAIAAQPGRMYRINVQQANNFPNLLGGSINSRSVLNCNGVSENSAGLLQFFTNNPQPAVDVSCTINRNSYDPNRKSADILGVGNQHRIAANTPLEYMIEFQNTGTDTARLVQLYDTIAPTLDINSIQMGAASHAYRVDMVGERTLRFTFERIMLVDSATNEPRSKGFVSFKINQKQDLPLGTVINNQASIYFDFNLPIQTNNVFHTIAQDSIPTVSVEETPNSSQQAVIQVYPNPLKTQAIFAVQMQETLPELSIFIYDATGKMVYTQTIHNQNQLQVERQNLSTGLYFFQLSSKGHPLGAGKIQVE